MNEDVRVPIYNKTPFIYFYRFGNGEWNFVYSTIHTYNYKCYSITENIYSNNLK